MDFSHVGVTVIDPIHDLEARAKHGKIDLVWSLFPKTVSHNISRSQSGGPPDVITTDYVTDYAVYADFGLPNETVLGEGKLLGVELLLGEHLITLRVTDSFGEVHTDDVHVTVQDTTPPIRLAIERTKTKCGGSDISGSEGRSRTSLRPGTSR